MSAIIAIFLGIIQGITEFLPVSSFGHICTAEDVLGITRGFGVLFETMLHMGTLAAIVMIFRKDLFRILTELLGMLLDVVGNIYLAIYNRRTGEELSYAKVVQGTWRKLTALLLVSFLPTMLLGYVSRRLVVKAAASPLIPGIGALLTGIVLLVADVSGAGGEKLPREAGYGDAMWIGICQGLSVFPGLSRSALTISTALFCGFGRKFAVKYSYLLSVPAILGAFFVEVPQFISVRMTPVLGLTYILGTIAAGVVGCLVIRFMLRLTQNVKYRYFAAYSFLAGIFSLAVNFI